MAELDAELKILLKHWEESITRAQKSAKLPQLVYEETSRTVALLRDLFSPSFTNIYVNDENVFHEVKDYVALIAPEQANIGQTLQRATPHLRQFCHHQTDQILVR